MQVTTQDQEVIIDKVKAFVKNAHSDQIRPFAKEPYVLHLYRVMETCYLYANKLPVLAAALLHDVLEDTEVERDELRHFLESVMIPDDAAHTMSLVVELTDVYVKREFPHLNRAMRKEKEYQRLVNVSPDAQTIKYADIIDNAKDVIDDAGFAGVFLHEYDKLLSGMNQGEPKLHHETVRIVRECLQKLDAADVKR